jgi:hypothetical protein
MCNGPTGRLSRSRLLHWVEALVGLFCLAVALVYAYATAFSTFSWYDDAGSLMVSVRGFLDGHRLYTEIFSYYGPVYYFYQGFIHSALSIELTHDSTIGLCVVHWIVASSFMGIGAGVLTRSTFIGLLTFMAATLHLSALVSEPGHPQELVAIGLSLAVVVVAAGLERRWPLPVLGSICSLLILTKINVGAFFGIAMVLTLAVLLRRKRWYCAFLALSACLPFLLMLPMLSQSWTLRYSIGVAASLFSAGLVAVTFADEIVIPRGRIFRGAIWLTVTAGLLVLVSVLTGASLQALVGALINGPSKLGTSFCVPLRIPWSLASALAGLTCAGILSGFRFRSPSSNVAISAAKFLYSFLGLSVLLTNYNAQIGYLLPWSWLVLVPSLQRRMGQGPESITRVALVMLAIWQSLQAYPVAGTQAAIGTLLLIPVYGICLHDSCAVLGELMRTPAVLRLQSSPSGVAIVRGLSFATLVCVFAMTWCNPFSAWRQYAGLTPLGLKGAKRLRLPADQVEVVRSLARYVGAHSDGFYTIPGFCSLYFWVEQSPPTYLIMAETLLLSREQQERVVAALTSAQRPLIVTHGQGSPASVGSGPLIDLVQTRCQQVQRYGSFKILSVQPSSIAFAGEPTKPQTPP